MSQSPYDASRSRWPTRRDTAALEAEVKRLAADNYALAGRALHAEAEVERLTRELDRVTRGTYSLELARLSKKCNDAERDLAAALAAEKGEGHE